VNVIEHLEMRCLACGVRSVHEARFCRQCGTMLRLDDFLGSTQNVSPDALTVEFHEPRRNTTPLLGPFATAPAVGHTTDLEEIAPPEKAIEEPTGGVAEIPIKEERIYASQPLPAKAPAFAPRPSPKRNQRRMAVAGMLVLVGFGGLMVLGMHRKSAASLIPNAAPVPVASLKQEDDHVPTGPEPSLPASVPAQVSSPAPSVAVKTEAATTRRPARRAPKTVEIEPSHTTADRADPPPQTVATAAPKKTAPGRVTRDPNELYQRAMNIVRGRDVKKLSRAELLLAMQYFQNIRSGPNRLEADRQAELLGREIDRRTWK
jgi:hypothetical protein